MKKINKKILIPLIILIIVIIILLIIFICNKKNNSKNEDLNETIFRSEKVQIKDVKDGDKYKQEFNVINDSDEEITYDLVWANTTNNYNVQSNLLYNIKSKSKGAISIGTSQVPVTDSPIVTDIKLEAKSTHKYTLNIWYKEEISSDEVGNTFNGYVQAVKH